MIAPQDMTQVACRIDARGEFVPADGTQGAAFDPGRLGSSDGRSFKHDVWHYTPVSQFKVKRRFTRI